MLLLMEPNTWFALNTENLLLAQIQPEYEHFCYNLPVFFNSAACTCAGFIPPQRQNLVFLLAELHEISA